MCRGRSPFTPLPPSHTETCSPALVLDPSLSQWALLLGCGCHSDGCQVPEADSQRWGCRLHPRRRLRGASHCVEKGMLPRQPTPTKGQGPALPAPLSLPTSNRLQCGLRGKSKFQAAQHLASRFPSLLQQHLYLSGPTQAPCSDRGRAPTGLRRGKWTLDL